MLINNAFIELKDLINDIEFNYKETRQEVLFDFSTIQDNLRKELTFKIIFNEPIIAYRTSQYRWQKNDNIEFIANIHSPKILVLKNGFHVVSNKNYGAWLISNKEPNTLTWILNHRYLKPVFNFKEDNTRDFLVPPLEQEIKLKLLFTKNKVPEFSRSRIPFSAILCFTDHCDFDTRKNLEAQLKFINEYQIIITKGIFPHHFSKRKYNASYQDDKDIYLSFLKSGHELACHSITQSMRKEEEAIKEFNRLKLDENINLKTWIDHGSQYYNFTNKSKGGMDVVLWSSRMKELKIENFWSYSDSGISGKGIINQLNPKDFTLINLIKKNLSNPSLIFRSAFHFHGTEIHRKQYKDITRIFKLILYKRQYHLLKKVPLRFFNIVFNFIKFFHPNKIKVPFKLARFSPFIYQYCIGNEVFNIFQSLEVTNFENTFRRENIDLLIQDRGACIAHCYFTSNIKHQSGRFMKGLQITPYSDKNFQYLHLKIKSEELWNPTLRELIEFQKSVVDLEYKFDNGNYNIITGKHNVPIRYISYV